MTSIRLTAALAIILSLPALERGPSLPRSAPVSQTPLPAIAVTFDDLPLGGRQIGEARLRAMTDKLVASIVEAGVPAVGFVNEGKLYDGEALVRERVEILDSWPRSGLELGNHTFSHAGLHGTPPGDVKDDVLRGASIAPDLNEARGIPYRYFRHPYLHTGRSMDVKRDFEGFLDASGYTVAPVTVENSDWMFAALYERAVSGGDEERRRRIATAYLQFTEAQLRFFEGAAEILFDRPIPHVLLLHANELNADYFAAIVGILEAGGYSFVTLEEALRDPAYRHADVYTGAAGVSWIFRWDHYEVNETGAARRIDWRAEPVPPEWVVSDYEGLR